MNKLNRILWSGLALGLVACGDDVTVQEPTPGPTPGIASVTVNPSPVTLQLVSSGTQPSVQMAASVTLQPGATGTPTITWATSAASVATVSGTGLVTAVGAGSAAITATATLGTSVAQGGATVNVLGVAACTITGVTVSPSPSADMIVNQTITLTAAATGSAGCTSAQLSAFTFSGGTTGIATINTTTGVITAVGAGTTTFTATSTTDPSKKAVMSVNVTVPAPATVSIQSITQYATNVPVDLSNVGGQIEITLNVDPGAAQSIKRAQALINGIVVAEQCFDTPTNCGLPAASASEAPQAAPQTLILSTNTRQVKKVSGKYVPVIFNGPGQITARVYTAAPVPASSNAVPVVMQNADAILGSGWVLAPVSATPKVTVGGNDWYKGNVSLSGGTYISFFPVTPELYFESNICDDTDNMVTGTPQTGITLAGTFDCAGDEGEVVPQGYYVEEGTAPAADVIYVEAGEDPEVVGSMYKVNGDERYNLLSASWPDEEGVYADNKGPTVQVATGAAQAYMSGYVAFNDSFDQYWINGSYTFAGDWAVYDGGVGADSAATVKKLWVSGTPGSCSGTTIGSGADLAETVVSDGSPDGYRMCASGADRLGNTGVSGASNWFGVDKVAPVVRLAGSTAATPAFVGTITVSSTANTTIYDMNVAAGGIGPAAVLLPAENWGLEGQDTRSGFNQNAVSGYPASQTLARLAPAAPTSCALFTNPMNVVLSDNYVRTAVSVANNCAQGVGYYTYNGKAYDRAGNVSNIITRNFAVEDANPTLSSIGLSSTFYTAAQAANFYLFGSDDLEVISTDLTLTMPGSPVTLTYPRNAAGTAWDATLSNLVTGATTTIGYFLGRLDFTCSGAAAPYASCVTAGAMPPTSTEFNNVAPNTDDAKNPTNVAALAYDLAGQASAGAATGLLTAQTNDVTQKWVGAGIDLIGWKVLNLTATTIQAEHKASTSITEPYFDTVVLVKNTGANAIVCGTFAAPVLTDNGVNRFWTYSATLPLVANAPWCTVAGTWHAVGVKSGAALVTLPGL